MTPLDRLSAAIAERLAGAASAPLLVFRVPEFERVAWRRGRRAARALERQTEAAFARAVRDITRCGDCLAHDDGSDCFVVALLSPARRGGNHDPAGVRAALERIGASLASRAGRSLESGWSVVEGSLDAASMRTTLDAALERGARERRHGAMLATVGHELRTPLTSIRGYVETLLDGEVDAATSRRFLETIRREALRLGRLVEGMLEFSMLDLRSGWAQEACDVAECARAAIETALPLARRRDVELRARPLRCVRARVNADLAMHALINLVENAVNYCGENGVVDVTCTHRRGFAVIVVDDNGQGVPRNERRAIFDLGVRAASTPPGSGIGLAVVKAVAERAGGSVRATSSPLGGARFILRFPHA